MKLKFVDDTGKEEKETYSYRGWLNSDKYWRRSWAIFGYNLVANITLGIILFLVIFFLSFFI